MKLLKVKGSTSQILEIFIQDSSSTTGAGLTGLVFNSAGLVCYYHRNTAAAGVAVSLVTMTVGAFTPSGFKEVDSVNLPGCYQLCLPDAAYATGAEGVIASLKGATNMAPLLLEVQLTGVDHSDAAAFGMSRLDVAVSTRNASAPDNTSIATILTRTDVATSTRASATDYTTARAAKIDNLDATVSSRNSVAPLSASQTENAVWDATAASHVTAGSMGSKEANLDATVSSRLATSGYTTPPTVVQTRQEMDANSTKLANLDVAVSTRNAVTPLSISQTENAVWDAVNASHTTAGSMGAKQANADVAVSTRSSHTAADIWAVGTRSLTTFGTLVADIATAVWGAASRTLTALTGVPTASQNAAAVWSESLPGSYASTQAGYKLNAAGSAADPLLNAVPGIYASGTAGAALGRVGVASVTVVSPVSTTGVLTIEPGDDYAASEARTFDFINAAGTWVDLTGATLALHVYRYTKELFNAAGTAPTPSGANQTVRFVLTAANTALLTKGDANTTYSVKATLTNGHVITLTEGKVTVS